MNCWGSVYWTIFEEAWFLWENIQKKTNNNIVLWISSSQQSCIDVHSGCVLLKHPVNNLLFQKQSHTAHEGDGEMLLDEQGHDVLLHLLLYLPPDEALDLVLDHPDDPLGVLLGFQAGRNHHVYFSRSWNGLFVCSNVFCLPSCLFRGSSCRCALLKSLHLWALFSHWLNFLFGDPLGVLLGRNHHIYLSSSRQTDLVAHQPFDGRCFLFSLR